MFVQAGNIVMSKMRLLARMEALSDSPVIGGKVGLCPHAEGASLNAVPGRSHAHCRLSIRRKVSY
jgi:hypothetical protein